MKKMIIKFGNLTYFAMFAFTAGLVLLFTFLLKNKPDKIKKQVLYIFCLLNIVFWIGYKIDLFIGHPDLDAKGYTFNIWLELPIQLCNISLFLIPIGLLLNDQRLLSYGFYIAPLGAFMAITFADPDFTNSNIFYLHNIGYYGTHINIIVAGILLVTLGYFTPSFKQLPFLILFLFVLSLSIFGVNLLIRKFCHADANYFYTVDPNGIFILEFFWSILPVKYLYCIFAIIILLAYCSLVNLPFYFVKKAKDKKKILESEMVNYA